MPIFLGQNKIVAVAKGLDEISKIYSGADLVWQKDQPVDDYIFYSEFKSKDPSWTVRGGSFEFGENGMFTADNSTKGTVNASELGYDYTTNFVKILDANNSIVGNLSDMDEIIMVAKINNTVSNNRIGGVKIMFYDASNHALAELNISDAWGASKNMTVGVGMPVAPNTGIGTAATTKYNNLVIEIKVKVGNDSDPDYCELWVADEYIGSNSIPNISTAKSMQIFANAYLATATYPMPESSLRKLAITRKPPILPLAEYTFDSVDGRTVHDTSGNGHDITANVAFSLVDSFVGKGRGGAPAANSNGFGSPGWLPDVQEGEFAHSFCVNTDYLSSSGNWVIIMGHSTLGGGSSENTAKIFYLRYAPNGSAVVDNSIAFGGTTNGQTSGVIRLKLNNASDMHGHWVIQGNWDDTSKFEAYRNGEFYGYFTQEPGGVPSVNADLFGGYKAASNANNDLLQSLDQYRVFGQKLPLRKIKELSDEAKSVPEILNEEQITIRVFEDPIPVGALEFYIEASNSPTSFRIEENGRDEFFDCEESTGRVYNNQELFLWTEYELILYASNEVGESEGKIIYVQGRD